MAHLFNSGQLGERIVAAADTVGSAIKNPFKTVTNSVRAFPLNLVRGVKDVGEGVKEASDTVKVKPLFKCVRALL